MPERLKKKLEKLVEQIVKEKRVVGWDSELKPKIRRGRETDEPSIRFYVENKRIPQALKPYETLPEEVEGIKTDVVEVGHLAIPTLGLEKKQEKRRLKRPFAVDPTRRVRPLRIGLSIGNIRITAGTLGAYYVYKNELVLGSNAHVFASSAVKPPSQQAKEVLQPGPYHGGVDLNNLAGYLEWYLQLHGTSKSNCPIGRTVATVFNTVASLLNAKTRLVPIVEADNNVDFAISTCEVDILNKNVKDESMEDKVLVGHLFAGSDYSTVFCKIGNILKHIDLEPVSGQKFQDAVVGDVLEAWSWVLNDYHGSCWVNSTSANVTVDYGEALVLMRDVGLASAMAKPGSSGSGLYKAKI